MRRPNGFTLIEFMIAIGIIGIIATVAIPAYNDYTIRARVSEGLDVALSARRAVSETYHSTGVFSTAGNASYGLPVAASINGSYVSSVSVAGMTGVVTIEFRRLAAGKVDSGDTMILTPVTSMPGTMNWNCSSTTIPAEYIPENCL